MAAQSRPVAVSPVAHLTARELLRVVDRSHPHTDALARHLERYIDSFDALEARLNNISDQAESCVHRAVLVRQMPAFHLASDHED